jgi:hypothetical protein
MIRSSIAGLRDHPCLNVVLGGIKLRPDVIHDLQGAWGDRAWMDFVRDLREPEDLEI